MVENICNSGQTQLIWKEHCTKSTGWWHLKNCVPSTTEYHSEMQFQILKLLKNVKKDDCSFVDSQILWSSLIYLGSWWFAETTENKNGWFIENIFFCQPTGKMPALAKASHLSKVFHHVRSFTCGKNSTVMIGIIACHCMFWRGKLVKSDTCG